MKTSEMVEELGKRGIKLERQNFQYWLKHNVLNEPIGVAKAGSYKAWFFAYETFAEYFAAQAVFKKFDHIKDWQRPSKLAYFRQVKKLADQALQNDNYNQLQNSDLLIEQMAFWFIVFRQACLDGMSFSEALTLYN